MKLTRIMFLTLLVVVFVLGFGIIPVNGAESPVEKDVTIKNSKAFTISDWLNSLDTERQAQVLSIFKRNLICAKNGEEKSKSKPEGQVLKETLHIELQAVLTPGQFEVFESIVFGNQESNPSTPLISTTLEDDPCDECEDARINLNQAKSNLYSAINNYDISDCDYYPFHIDYVKIYLGMAYFHTKQAFEMINDAYLDCVCPDEEDLWEHIDYARDFADTAADYAFEYCDPNAIWISQLGAAITNLAYAKYFSIDDCLDQVCN